MLRFECPMLKQESSFTVALVVWLCIIGSRSFIPAIMPFTKNFLHGEGSMPVFVVHKHYASTLHYDFRLEKAGVLKSWAVPKGIAPAPGVKRLAVEVEDHALSYAGFAGAIPERQYGAGTVAIWDTGEYEEEQWQSGKIVVALHGKKLSGRFCLIRFAKAGEKNWLIFAL